MGKEWDSFKQGRLKDYTKPPGGNISRESGGEKLSDRLGTMSFNQHANRRCLKCNHYQFSGTPCKCAMPEWAKDTSTRDTFIAFLREVMTEALRVLKPGGHALVWALPRTSHWTATALEDAGFECRNKLYHCFGSGFPKSKNLGNGVGSDLKPSVEEWILVRKPLAESSLQANYAKWGTGGLQIDKCRVGAMNESLEQQSNRFPSTLLLSHSVWCVPTGTRKVRSESGSPHIVRKAQSMFSSGNGMEATAYHDEDGMETVQAYDCTPDCPVRRLDEQSGIRGDTATIRTHSKGKQGYHGNVRDFQTVNYGDTGGASRYFQNFPPSLDADDFVPFQYVSKASRANRSANGTVNNTHPTCKNTELMRWLIRLITPPGGVVLDPFGGSGSTAVAAIYEEKHFILVEQDESYVNIANARIAYAREHPPHEVKVPTKKVKVNDKAHDRHNANGKQYNAYGVYGDCVTTGHADQDGLEEVEDWICDESCPVKIMNDQSGILHARGNKTPTKAGTGLFRQENCFASSDYVDDSKGGAARYFQQFPPDSLFAECSFEEEVP